MSPDLVTLGANPYLGALAMYMPIKPRLSRIDPDHVVFAVGLIALATSLLVVLLSPAGA